MKIIKDPYTKLNTLTVVALGCFDGVHTAHAEVISHAVQKAAELGCGAAVWCFSEPPKNAYLKVPVPLICDEEEKARLIRKLGADILISPDFNEKISAVSAEAFVRELLFECAGAVHVVCGGNYTFGRGGCGKAEDLCRICKTLGIGVSIVGDVSIDGVNVSSTLVREAVENGQTLYAAKLLGRDFSLCADISECEGSMTEFFVGRKYLSPAEGTYKVTVRCGARRESCDASVKKTLDGARISLPLAFDGGKLRVSFVSNRVREKKTVG